MKLCLLGIGLCLTGCTVTTTQGKVVAVNQFWRWTEFTLSTGNSDELMHEQVCPIVSAERLIGKTVLIRKQEVAFGCDPGTITEVAK